MRPRLPSLALVPVALAWACADEPPPVAPPPTIAAVVRSDEEHLEGLEQITFGGDHGKRGSWRGDEVVPDEHAGEKSVCAKDGSILFSSRRDGDWDLYRSDAEGSGLRRLTATVGYDGDPAFDADCSHIVWVASRPRGKELEAYKKAYADRVVPRDHVDLWIANADGTDARQITYLEAASSSPVWYPSGTRILFASDYGSDPRGAPDVDLWAVDVDGTSLERVTTAPGFDGFPAFSPDGKSLAFTSERATPLGSRYTNVFSARWVGAWRHVEERPADHVMGDAAWLADSARGGRVLGTKGLEDAGAYVERSLRSFGLAPGAGDDDYRLPFDVVTRVGGAATLAVGGGPESSSAIRALGISASASVEGPLVYVGADEDYARIDARGRIVVVRAASRASPRHAAWLAHDRGAVGILFVSDGDLPDPTPETDEGIPAAIVSPDALGSSLAGLVRGQHPRATLAVTLAPEKISAFDVVARWPASVPPPERLPGVIVLGAHYDHDGEPGPGADDNASGVAVLLQVARSLAAQKPVLRRDLLLVALSGEEQGGAGATAFLHDPPAGLAAKDVMAMIDLDMVGRLRETLQVFGAETATQWPDLLRGACEAAHIACTRATGGGFGGRDLGPFYEAGVPVLHLFTGMHADYHRPTDTAGKLNAAGMERVARVAEQLASDVADLDGRLDTQHLAAPPESDVRELGVSLGIRPDRAGPPKGAKGVLLAGVRPGGAADVAGLRRGDLLVRLGGHVIGGVEDVMFVLTGAKPGAKMRAVVVRDGAEKTVDVVLQATP